MNDTASPLNEVQPVDWAAVARREAAAILAELCNGSTSQLRDEYNLTVSLLAIAWIQGMNYGAHHTLHAVERSFDSMTARLREETR